MIRGSPNYAPSKDSSKLDYIGFIFFDLGDRMESSSVDSTVSSLTMMDEDEHIPHQFSSIAKLHNNGPGTTSVHELLECPVCTSSMYPPIHQVCYHSILLHGFLRFCFHSLLTWCLVSFSAFRLCDLLVITILSALFFL